MNSYYEQFMAIIGREKVYTGSPIILEESECFAITREIHELDIADDGQALTLAAFIHYGQCLGGKQFIDALDMGETLKTEMAVRWMELLLTHPKIAGVGYESEKERQWRLEIYEGIDGIGDGFASYSKYQPGNLLYESERFLHEEISFLLDAIALISPEEFVALCNVERNPLWSLRWVERSHDCFSESVLDQSIVKRFNPAYQGLISSYLWDKCLQSAEGKFRKDADKLLAFEIEMPAGYILTILPRVLSGLTIKRFSSLRSNPDEWKQASRLDILLELATAHLQKSFPLTQSEIDRFIKGFHSPLNSETIWACLVVARLMMAGELSDEQKETIIQIRSGVLAEYPSYWKTKGHRFSFGGELTLALIDELALALYTVHGGIPHERLDEYKEIPALESVLQLREQHEYGDYREARDLLLVHTYLASRLLMEEEGSSDSIALTVERFLGYVEDLWKLDFMEDTAEFTQSIKEHILTEIGSLAEKHGYPVVYQKIVSAISNPFDYLAISKGVGGEQERERLFGYVEQRLPYFWLAFSKDELIHLGVRIYKLGNFPLAIKLMVDMERETLSAEQVSLWKRILSTAYLNVAFQSEDSVRQTENLRRTLIYSRLDLGDCYDFYQKDNRAVTVQTIAWLYDRNEATREELSNAYNLIAFNLAEEERNWQQPEDYYVCCMVLIRLLSITDNLDQTYLEQMRIAVERMGDIPEQRPFQEMIRAWYASVINPGIPHKGLIFHHDDEIQQSLQWLPQCLREMVTTDN